MVWHDSRLDFDISLLFQLIATLDECRKKYGPLPKRGRPSLDDKRNKQSTPAARRWGIDDGD